MRLGGAARDGTKYGAARAHPLTSDPIQAGDALDPSVARDVRDLRLLRRLNLGQLTLGDQSQLREVRAARSFERLELILHAANLRARLVDDSLGVGLRLAKNERRFLVRLLLDVCAQLLRGDERFVDGLVALAKCAKLLVESARLRVEILVQSRETLELFGDLIAELVDALRIVAAQRFPELVSADVERR